MDYLVGVLLVLLLVVLDLLVLFLFSVGLLKLRKHVVSAWTLDGFLERLSSVLLLNLDKRDVAGHCWSSEVELLLLLTNQDGSSEESWVFETSKTVKDLNDEEVREKDQRVRG